jgi:hypothetical protein
MNLLVQLNNLSTTVDPLLFNDLLADTINVIQLCNQSYMTFRKLLFWNFDLCLQPREVVTFLDVMMFVDEGCKADFAKKDVRSLCKERTGGTPWYLQVVVPLAEVEHLPGFD